jgi:hypothetical protein
MWFSIKAAGYYTWRCAEWWLSSGLLRRVVW